MPPRAKPKGKNATAQTENTDSNPNSDTEDEQQYLTESKFDERLAKFEETLKIHLQAIEKNLTDTIDKLHAELDEIGQIARNAIKLAENNNKEIVSLKDDINNLNNENKNLKDKINSQNEIFKILEERIESRTNRQLRKTLVFKGIPEKQYPPLQPDTPNQHQKKESWDDTESILAHKISEICENTTINQARDMIERCHRANENPNYKGQGPRVIFAAFYDWKQSEFVKEEFRTNNVADRECKIFAENKYGPLTTLRRNKAMQLRKTLKDNGTITRGYVAFPARLMVALTNNRKEQFRQHEDFSKVAVEFRQSRR